MKKNILLRYFIVSTILSDCVFAQNSTILPSSIQVPNVSALGTCSTIQKGQLAYLTSDNQTYYCDGTTWQRLLITANVANTDPWLLTGNHIYNSNTANVGIGLNNPSRAKFEVAGVSGVGNTNAFFGSGSSGISLQQNWPTIGFNQYRDNTVGNGRYMTTGYAAIQFFDPNTGSMYFNTLGNGAANGLTNQDFRALTIYNTGNVAIKGDGNTASLYVKRGNGGDGTAVFEGTTHRSHFNFASNENTYIRAGKDNSDVFINDIPNGNVQFGSGTTKLSLNRFPSVFIFDIEHKINDGGIRMTANDFNNEDWELRNYIYSNDNMTTCLTLYHNSSLQGWFRPTDGGYTAYSDKRMKTKIEDVEPILNKVLLLKPSRYEPKYQNPAHSKSYGFLAQEMKEVFPEMVDTLPTKTDPTKPESLDNAMGINYSQLSVIAIKAIQEQQAIIEELKKEINLLKQKIKD